MVVASGTVVPGAEDKTLRSLSAGDESQGMKEIGSFQAMRKSQDIYWIRTITWLSGS